MPISFATLNTSFQKAKADRLYRGTFRLDLDQDTLKSPDFLAFLNYLNTSSRPNLVLNFPDATLKNNIDQLVTYLETHIADNVRYPVCISRQGLQARLTPAEDKRFKPFTQRVITSMRTYYQEHCLHVPLPENMPFDLGDDALHDDMMLELTIEHVEEEVLEATQEEQLEATQEKQITLEEETTEVFDGETVNYAQFSKEAGLYLGTGAHRNPAHTFGQECFANMPHAIRFYSHEAADYIADHPRHFVAINADNLPQHFKRKQNARGQFVLDYSKTMEEHKTNVFTPKAPKQHSTIPLSYYDASPLPETHENNSRHAHKLRGIWIKYGQLGLDLFQDALAACDTHHPECSAFLMEHHLNYLSSWEHLLDDELFLDALKTIQHYDAIKLASLKEFLAINTNETYFELSDTVVAFEEFWKQWSTLAEQNNVPVSAILESWAPHQDERLVAGNPVVYMERLLTILHNARDLREQLFICDRQPITLIALPEQYQIMDLDRCDSSLKEGQITLIKLTNAYAIYSRTEHAGWKLTPLDPNNPAHATLLTQIEGIRAHFPGQNDYWHHASRQASLTPDTHKYADLYNTILSGKHHTREKITLDNYGAYYASKYEGFRMVSSQMGLTYDRQKRNQKPFNPDAPVYRTDFSWLTASCMAELECDGRDTYPALIAEDPKNYYLIDSDKSSFSTTLQQEVSSDEGLQALIGKHNLTLIPYHGQPIESSQALYKTHGEASQYPSLYKKRLLEEAPAHMQYLGKNRPTPDEYYQAMYRILGQGIHGPRIQDFSSALNNFLKQYYNPKSYTTVALASLFFICHERFTGKVDLTQVLQEIESTKCHQEVLRGLLQGLAEHFQAGTYLSDEEGMALCNRLARLNSAEFESTGLPKDTYIKKLFSHLEKNKHGTLKAIKQLAKNPRSKWPFVYALDAADNLLENPIIATAYANNLFLFCTLINSDSNETFTHTKQSARCYAITQKSEHIEALKTILIQAATEEQPNNLMYAYKRLAESGQYFTHKRFFDACQTIQEELQNSFNPHAVGAILERHELKLRSTLPEIFSRDNQEIRHSMIQLLSVLNIYHETGELQLNQAPSGDMLSRLRACTLHELQLELNEAWQQNQGHFMAGAAKSALTLHLKNLGNRLIHEQFASLGDTPEIQELANKLLQLQTFQNIHDFETLDIASKEAEQLRVIFERIFKQAHVNPATFSTLNYSHYGFETLFELLSLLADMQDFNYDALLKTYLNATHDDDVNKKHALMLIIRRLKSEDLPSAYIERLLNLFQPNHAQFERLIEQTVRVFHQNPDDPCLAWLLQTNTLDLEAISIISDMTHTLSNKKNQHMMHQLLSNMHQQHQLIPVLDAIKSCDAAIVENILLTLAITYDITPTKVLSNTPLDYQAITQTLLGLPHEHLEQLKIHMLSSPVSLPCLIEGLENRDENLPFSRCLEAFEKAPFGTRNLEVQFDISQVERVVNHLIDLNTNTPYPYTYRKQLAEAFLLINRAGYDLPLYHNKPAKDLSNAELHACFQELKNNTLLPRHTPFQRRVYALALIREAMYRKTGQFPYSTQIIAILDTMMHDGDVLSNIHTGEGKSLVDMMKASLLWLDSTRVDISTSSIEDATRDLDAYSPFLTLLGIPHARTPLTTQTDLDEYISDGINVSTMSQLALVELKAKTDARHQDRQHERAEAIVSLVMNESDFTLLDDTTVCRYARTTGDNLLGLEHTWFYDVINDCIDAPLFKSLTPGQRAAKLQYNLYAYAATHQKSTAIIEAQSPKRLHQFIQSACIARDKIHEDYDYVLTQTAEFKKIGGRNQLTRRAKHVMSNSKVSPDIQYGKCVQQCLYARLNRLHGPQSFVIEPESKTLMALNNKAMLDNYRAKKGFVWGSSATLGSSAEIAYQAASLGFACSGIPPHRARIATEATPLFLDDESAQFEALRECIQNTGDEPHLLFFKDIPTLERFSTYINAQDEDSENIQVYNGLGDEAHIIQRAATPGMVTLTTPALGRNSDVPYNPSVGMHVIQTDPTSISRGQSQRSGRTGRQGSNGRVSFIYNTSDLNGQSIEAIQRQHEEIAEATRQFNNELYDILGGILRQIPHDTHPHFYKQHWPDFSATVEENYRRARTQSNYVHASFVAATLDAFNNEFVGFDDNRKHVITTPIQVKHVFLPESKPKQPKPEENMRSLHVSDCISPDVLAYHFVRAHDTNRDAAYNQADIHAKLDDLFNAIGTDRYSACHADYINYLNLSAADKSAIRNTHETYLKQFLAQQKDLSENMPWYQRWLGYEGHLTRVVADDRYLMLFSALLQVNDEPLDATSELKDAVTTLLDEYLAHSWFVSSHKKHATHALKQAIAKTETTQELIECLNAHQTCVLESDIRTNQNPWLFWRMLKPVNTCNSRLQTTLDHAQALISATTKQITPDAKETLSAPDKANAVVIEQTRLMRRRHDSLYQPFTGMCYRDGVSSDSDTSSLNLPTNVNG